MSGLAVLGRLRHAVAILITGNWCDPRKEAGAHGQQFTGVQQLIDLLTRSGGRHLDVLGRQGCAAFLGERSDPSRPGFRIADRLGKKLGFMQQSSSLTFLRAKGDGFQHACHLLFTAAGANL